jgi:Domain of unknown function (DUF7014)/AbiJ N-terminal domain 4
MQVRYILNDIFGPLSNVWYGINTTLRREMGVSSLSDECADFKKDCIGAILLSKNTDNWLDIVEVCFVAMLEDKNLSKQQKEKTIEELNFRFREAGLGYQFENGQIIRVDAQLVHSEVVKPALALLADPRLEGAQEEFLSAHAHYRAGEYEDAIVDANRAFESTMKAICDIKDWQYPKGARAADLVKIIRRKGLLPRYLDASFDQFVAILKSGLPQVRHDAGGHGQGAKPRQTPGYIAGYALHLAAANIVLLGEALKASE